MVFGSWRLGMRWFVVALSLRILSVFVGVRGHLFGRLAHSVASCFFGNFCGSSPSLVRQVFATVDGLSCGKCRVVVRRSDDLASNH